LFKYLVSEKAGSILLSALVAHSGWHWMVERNSNFNEYIIVWPEFNADFYAELMRWGMLAIIVGIASWLMFELAKYIEKRAK
ncbi:MAG: hypothetical protein HOM01_12570, partial [Kordiimonadaceae bacterium]|nr:hypothetical protein [Kordiimonadaceae bacterium]